MPAMNCSLTSSEEQLRTGQRLHGPVATQASRHVFIGGKVDAECRAVADLCCEHPPESRLVKLLDNMELSPIADWTTMRLRYYT